MTISWKLKDENFSEYVMIFFQNENNICIFKCVVGGWNEMKLEKVCKLKHQNSDYKIIVFRALSTNQLFAGCPTTLAAMTLIRIFTKMLKFSQKIKSNEKNCEGKC
jgi:hypothetical protein